MCVKYTSDKVLQKEIQWKYVRIPGHLAYWPSHSDPGVTYIHSSCIHYKYNTHIYIAYLSFTVH
jgi:hypothetical protein